MSHWIVRYLGCHFGWHGNIMAPDHPKMILEVHRDRMPESKMSLDGFMIRPFPYEGSISKFRDQIDVSRDFLDSRFRQNVDYKL